MTTYYVNENAQPTGEHEDISGIVLFCLSTQTE